MQIETENPGKRRTEGSAANKRGVTMKRLMNVLNRGAEVFARFVLFCVEKAEPATRKVEPIWCKISSFCRTHKDVTGVCTVLLLAALVFGDYLLKPYWNFTPFTNWKRYTSSRGDYIQFLSPEQASQYQYMIGLDIYEGYGYNFKRMWCGLEGIQRVLCKAKVIAVRDVVHVKKGYKVPHPNPREQVGGSENRMNSDFESIVLLEVEKAFFDPDQTLTKNLIRVYSMASAIENTGYSSTYPPLIVGDTYYLTMIPVKSLWPDGKGLGTEYYPYYAIKELQYEAMAPFFYENVD